MLMPWPSCSDGLRGKEQIDGFCKKARTIMKPTMTYHEALHLLHRAGFVGKEIDRLYHLSQTYRRSEMDQPPLDPYRLRFVRWLVTTGRLTEQLPERRDASPDPSPQQKGQSVPFRAHFAFPLFRRKERHTV